jgi:hypothetical protein
LVELPVSAALWAIGPPDGLNLVALEWEIQFAMVHSYIPCKRDGKIIPQCALSNIFVIFSRKHILEASLRLLQFGGVVEPIVQDLENEFITFVPIFSHQCVQVLHGRGLQRLKTE